MQLNTLCRLGVTVVEATSEQICDAAAGADVVLVETPTNPGLDVVDLQRLATICRASDARLIVDNTTATPLGQQPLSLGADLVVASATKTLSGHSDVLAGYVAGNDPDLIAAVERHRLLAGAILGAFEAWLVLRGLASAGLRFERQCHNAHAVATMLRDHSGVRVGRYPGLAEDPAHPMAAAQMTRFGAWSLRSSPTPPRCTPSYSAASCSSWPPASAACTPAWTAEPAGETPSQTDSPASHWVSRTPTTFSPISSRLSRQANDCRAVVLVSEGGLEPPRPLVGH
jgi:hypothetical protein